MGHTVTAAKVSATVLAGLAAVPEVAELMAGPYRQTSTRLSHQPTFVTVDEARCAGQPIDVFFGPEHLAGARAWSTAPAVSICGPCPVRGACLAYALPISNLYGVWGGSTRAERAALRRLWRTESKQHRP